MPKFILLILLFSISFTLKAQTWEIGGAFGGAGYMGDLNPNNPVKISGPLGNVFLAYNFNGYLSFKAGVTLAHISAADSNSSNQQFRNRNLSFETSIHEESIIGEFNFMKYIPQIGTNIYTPYVYVGIARLSYNPFTVFQGNTYGLRGRYTEGKTYPNVAIAIPYGIGIKYNIAGRFTLGADIGYRNPNTDYLDDVSGLYPDKSKSPTALDKALSDRSGEKTGVYIGTPGTQRGDLNPRDTYFFTQITLSYTFISEKCYFQ